jgi:two-component system chemotaxis response regulator CheY
MFAPDTRILVVDDMKTMRLIVKKNLANLGYKNVLEAEDGEAAWKEIEKALTEMNPFKFIVSDWTMPKMTGLELLKKVRAHEQMKSTPFLMVTAEADIALVKEALAAGVSNYVTKPFTAETLQTKIAAIHQNLMKKAS